MEVLDLPRQSVDQLVRHASLRVILRLVQEIRNPDIAASLPDIFATLREIFTAEKNLAVLHGCLLYLLNQTDQELDDIARALDRLEIQDYGETMITTADKLRQEGELAKAIDTARKMREEGMDQETICRITASQRTSSANIK